MSQLQTRYAHELNTYCLGLQPMTPEYQLSVLENFWYDLGYDMPKLDEAQEQAIDNNLRTADRRIVLAPHFDNIYDRQHLGNAMKRASYPSLNGYQGFAFCRPPEQIRNESQIYSALLEDLDSTVIFDGNTYQIGYLASNGSILSRPVYKELIARQKTIKDGTPWSVQIMEIGANRRDYSLLNTARGRFEWSSAYAMQGGYPEAYMAVELLHIKNDTPRDMKRRINITNEAVYRVSENGQRFLGALAAGELVSIATVSWLPISRQLQLVSLPPTENQTELTSRHPSNPIL